MENDRAYLKLGYSSLFDYLVKGLGYSSSRAYERQSCLRLTKEIPELKEKIEEGKLSYSTLTTAFKVLKKKSTPEKRQVLQALENKSARQVKELLAEPAPPIQIKKTNYQDKVILRLELSHQVNQKLERLKALKSHHGGFEKLLEGLIDKELKEFQSTSFKPSKSQNPRFVSKTLRNHILKKADFRCQFPGCDSNHFLQIDHIMPVRVGGKSEPENLQVLCSAHNQMKG